jgi:small subunit ribosomal protein S3Ae
MATKNIVVKKKKKVWLSIYSPESLGNLMLGESNVYEKEELIGKTLSLNLATITNDMKKQNINVTFKVTDVSDNKGRAQLVDYVLVASYLKRLVRRSREKIEDSFLARTKDGHIVRVKPIARTNADTFNSIITKIRLGMKALIRTALKERTYEEFVNDLISLKIQKEMKEKLNKIYPLKYIDIRQVSLEEKGKLVDDNVEFVLPQKAEEEDLDESSEEKSEADTDESTESETSDDTEEEILDEEEDK